MADLNFLDADLEITEEDLEREISEGSSLDSAGNLTNKELIEKLKEQRQKLTNRIEHIDAVIHLLKATPNYARIHDMLNTEI
jgi:hypothetical protein